MKRAVAVELLENRKLLTSNLLTLGGPINDGAYAIDVAANGGRVVAGTFSGTIDFDPSASVKNLTARGQSDLFVAMYNPGGALAWAIQLGADAGKISSDLSYSLVQATIGDFINRAGPTIDGQGEYLSAMKVGTDGNIYIGGSFQGTVDFDPGAGAVNRRSTGYHDAFVAAISSTGSLVWASAFGGEFDDTVKDIAVQADGSVIATGYFTREADFNPTKQEKRVQAKGRDDIFVAKFKQTDSAPIARLQWVYTAGGDAVQITERDSGEGVALDSAGNVYVTGSFAGEADFDPSRSRLDVKAIDKTDGFLLRLSPKGKLDYIQPFGGEEFDSGKSLIIDSQDRLFISGYFEDVADLDPGDGISNFTAREDGDSRDSNNDDEGIDQFDAFVANLNTSGDVGWIQPIGGDDYEWLGQLRVSGTALLLSGAFAGTIEFGSGNNVSTLTSIRGDDDFEDDKDRESSYDALLARFDADTGAFSDAVKFGGTGDDWGTTVAVNNTTADLGGIFRNTSSFGIGGTTSKRKAVALQDLFAVGVDLLSELT